MFRIGDRVITSPDRYDHTYRGTITQVDSDGTVWGTFDSGQGVVSGHRFVRDGRMVATIHLVDE